MLGRGRGKKRSLQTMRKERRAGDGGGGAGGGSRIVGRVVGEVIDGVGFAALTRHASSVT